ncbi:glycan-binding surface protein [Parapedobacter tibetensis]|uniref:glycan-binding surface protein n=1 Tax=Parapedobacter tibetensis TaxID=2972951 RepID=UPI00214D794E|nr:glycan-binding surface protein [Parapedobacter tibetensis]
MLRDRMIFSTVVIGVVFGLFLMMACEKQDQSIRPTITGLRAISPAPNDSLLTRALPGETVVIMGTGFSHATGVFFNGYETVFNPALATDRTLVVTIPGNMPFGILNPEDLNTVRVVTKNGLAEVNFPVVPPEPIVSAISNEFGMPGETILLQGQYLYLLRSITFPGGIEATEFAGSDDGLLATVKVPPGATQAGALTLVNEGGSSSSAPMATWHDDSQVFLNFDDKNGFAPWGPKPIITDSYAAIPPYADKYLYWNMPNVTPGTWWCQDLATPTDGAKLQYPDDIADGEPITNLALKFEINVPGEGLKDGNVEFNFNWQFAMFWEPAENETLQTNGWKTVAISLSKLNNNPGTYQSIKGLGFNIFYDNGEGTQTADVDLAWDNFRIVKIRE